MKADPMVESEADAIATMLRARRLGLSAAGNDLIAVMRHDCPVCRSEGLASRAQVSLRAGEREVVVSLLHSSGDVPGPGEIGLSETAWHRLGVSDGDLVEIAHAQPLASLSDVRRRIYGNRLGEEAFSAIIADIAERRYSDVHLSAFVTACSAVPLDTGETISLTRAMVNVGERLSWPGAVIVDKHSVGGLPGNRTTPIIVSIMAAEGLIMPKTSSRAITSPAGTADTMEVLAPVDLDVSAIRRVVEREGGCIAWGGAVKLSPADDVIIGVERVLDIDAVGQMVASVLSKKIAAGATHLVIDIPVGPTAKVRSAEAAATLETALTATAEAFGLRTRVMCGPGLEPIGRGIGPALEAQDILAILQGEPGADDLAQRACELAGGLFELADVTPVGQGFARALESLESGRAWAKFQRICDAQGGMRAPPIARFQQDMIAPQSGRLVSIDNRKLATVAKLAGAPIAKAAGVALHCRLEQTVEAGAPLCTIHAESPGELDYAAAFAVSDGAIFGIAEA
ncbi:thymidine phosphorylase [Sphingobium sp. GW456-12-10-14-TSB1]|jgi:thymidine phosphorylase|uniref:thymidine phosphorylase family protein n=1 Tax=unclassified Sphingobium TaxID=2611147 RepID=UPI000A3908D1|nr:MULTISPECIES: thymidine phosphorylase family protein [unclassified Sphingobium]MBS88160.1 thymidine phosphorylase [Sphingobium sp.]OUC54464.1 thymidine phosphorylase [Sphingobium sp. GW456-12-10-14-TSB1]